ncbi:MAG: exonuclease SbcCD subunit D [Planctomycetota bacterium]
MRFLHTADWHLGRVLFGASLIEDQRHALEEVVRAAEDARVDAVLVAGDVYDRAVPPAEAVELLDEILSRLVLERRIPVVLVAGNHDSPHRLGFARRLLRSSGLHVFGALAADARPLEIRDRHGTVALYAIPYADPAAAREHLGRDDVRDHESALRALVARALEAAPDAARGRRILATHAFVAGGAESESERPLSVGGTPTVSASAFDGFHYVALGHLHRPQRAGADWIRYPGSLLKYSLSEVEHRKGVDVVEIDARGAAAVETIPIVPRRDFRLIEGRLEEILRSAPEGSAREDYLAVRLLDEGVLFDAAGKLREVYPNLVHIERPALTAPKGGEGSRPRLEKLSDEALFRTFWKEVTSEEFTQEHEEGIRAAFEEIERDRREAAREGGPKP